MRPDDDGLNRPEDFDRCAPLPAEMEDHGDEMLGRVILTALLLSPFALFFILRALLS
jgi:hypothetical protein